MQILQKKRQICRKQAVAWTHEILGRYFTHFKGLGTCWMTGWKKKMIQFWLFRMLGQKDFFDFWTFIQLFNKIEIIKGNLYGTFWLAWLPLMFFQRNIILKSVAPPKPAKSSNWQWAPCGNWGTCSGLPPKHHLIEISDSLPLLQRPGGHVIPRRRRHSVMPWPLLWLSLPWLRQSRCCNLRYHLEALVRVKPSRRGRFGEIFVGVENDDDDDDDEDDML